VGWVLAKKVFAIDALGRNVLDIRSLDTGTSERLVTLYAEKLRVILKWGYLC
jgi:hypothetical protein